MANKRIVDLQEASTLSGEEILEIVQGGASCQVTAQLIADLASGGGGGSVNISDVTGLGSGVESALTQTANGANGLMLFDDAGNADFPNAAAAFSALYIENDEAAVLLSFGANNGTAGWINSDGSFSLSAGNLIGDTSGNITLFGNILSSNGDRWADVNNRIIYDQYNEQAISTLSDTWNTDSSTTLISDPDYGYVAVNGELFVRYGIQVQLFGGSSSAAIYASDGSAFFSSGNFTVDSGGNVTLNGNLRFETDTNLILDGGSVIIPNGDLIVSNTDNIAKMRLFEKSNGEVTWSYNVDPNNSDALDDPTDMAWKFAMAGTGSTSSMNIQSMPAGAGSWGGNDTKIWSIAQNGALYMDSGAIITDGSGNMQWGNGESGYNTIINSTGALQYPYNDTLLTDTEGRLYYSSGVTLADNNANLYYGNGTTQLSDAEGRLYYGDGNAMTDPTVDPQVLNYPGGAGILADSNGYLYIQQGLLGNSDLPAIDNSGNFYYPNNVALTNAQLLFGPDGSVLVDTTVTPIQLNYPGLGSSHPFADSDGNIKFVLGGTLADENGQLYYSGNNAGTNSVLTDTYNNLYSGDGNVLFDNTTSPVQFNYAGLGSAHPLTDANGVLYWGGDGGGHPLADNYDILYLRGGLQDMTASNGTAGQVLTSDGTNATWQNNAGEPPFTFTEPGAVLIYADDSNIISVDTNGNPILNPLNGITSFIGFDVNGNPSIQGWNGSGAVDLIGFNSSGYLTFNGNTIDSPGGLASFNAIGAALAAGISITHVSNLGDNVLTALQSTVGGVNGLVVLNDSGYLCYPNSSNTLADTDNNIYISGGLYDFYAAGGSTGQVLIAHSPGAVWGNLNISNLSGVDSSVAIAASDALDSYGGLCSFAQEQSDYNTLNENIGSLSDTVDTLNGQVGNIVNGSNYVSYYGGTTLANDEYLYCSNGDVLADGAGNLYAHIPYAGSLLVGNGSAPITAAADDTSTPTNAVTPVGYIKVIVGTTTSWIPYYQ
jgi:hypothetical protein